MGYTNITTKKIYVKRQTYTDSANPEQVHPVLEASGNPAPVQKSWAMIQGKVRERSQKVAFMQFDEDAVQGLAKKAVWYNSGLDTLTYGMDFATSGNIFDIDDAMMAIQACQKSADLASLTYNNMPARVSLITIGQYWLAGFSQVTVPGVIWDDTQGYKTQPTLKQMLLYGVAFAIANDLPEPSDATKTQYGVYVPVTGAATCVQVHVADIQLEAENLSPADMAYVEPNAAAALTWTTKEPEAYFTDKPEQAQFEARYNVYANGDFLGWKTLTGTTEQKATIPAIDMANAEYFFWQVRIKSDDGVWGEWSRQNYCTCVSQSGKAIALSPDGASATAGEKIPFLWEHSSTSGLPQKGVEIQFQAPNAGGYTQIYASETKVRRAEVILPATLTATAGQAAWRVRTQDTGGTWSEWSEALYVYVVAAPQAPTVSVLSSGTMRPLIGWQSENQTGYRVKIRSEAGATVYDSGVQAGGEQNWQTEEYLQNGHYTAAVTIWNQYALESAEGTQPFTISAATPTAVEIDAEASETLNGEIRIKPQKSLSAFDEDKVLLLRDGTQVPHTPREGGGWISDFTAPPGTHTYILRVMTDSAYADSQPVTLAARVDCGILMLAEDTTRAGAMGKSVLLRMNRGGAPSHADDMAIEATQRGFAGRDLPTVEFSGRRDHIHRHTFALLERAEMQRLIDMLLEQKTMLYRDQYGRMYYCICASLPVTYDAFSESFTLELTEISNESPAQAAGAKGNEPDTADATAEDGDVALGKTYYARGEKRTGTYVSDGIRPRAWADIPIDYIRGKAPSGNDFYFQRIGSTEFLLVYPSTDDLSSIELTIAVDADTEVYREGIKVGDATAAAALVLEALDMSQPISLGLLWGEKKITISVEAKTGNSEFACVEIGAVVPVGSFKTVVSRKGEVFYYNQAFAAGALSIRTIVKRGAATLCQNGRVIVRPVTGDNENFVVFEALSPDGRYRKKYCTAKRPESAESIELEVYAYAAKAFVNEDSAFYDYAGAGFTPVTPQPAKADILAAADIFGGSAPGVKDENGRVQFGTGSSETVSFTESAENTLAEVISAHYSDAFMEADFDAKGNLLALKDTDGTALGKNTLTAGSRWLTFVNDKLIDMPGFLANVWPSTGMKVTFLYTCADGLDVGYPYAGA